jgi:hypothetical protein
MKLTRKKDTAADREPMGIVIADGGQPEGATRFLAYVWGPAPDGDVLPEEEELLVATSH